MNAFPALIGALALLLNLADLSERPAPNGPDHFAKDSSGRATGHAPPKCNATLDSVADEWRSRNEWRQLAPYPVAREASPTDSVGVWIERWHMGDGSVELRRIAAARTTLARVDANSCDHSVTTFDRHYSVDSLKNAFTDATVDSLLHANARGMIYVWSPRMPLSISGLKEAKATAALMRIAFIAVIAEANAEDLLTLNATFAVPRSDMRALESLELVYRNATIHYPAVLFYQHNAMIDGVIPGYKNRDTYAKLGKEWLDDARKFHAASSDSSLAASPPTFWVDQKAQVTTLSSIPTVRRIGFFFKPIAGTNLISYTSLQQDAAYLFDISSGKEQRIPGHVDPVPTPDGRFITLPGLKFHPLPQLIANNETPLFTDPELPDEYQTASILGENSKSLRYRIITGWRAGARFRDYDVTFDKKGQAATVTALDTPFVPCGDRLLTLPINAKSGYEFGAFDARVNSNFIIEVTAMKTCVDKLNLGFATGKISFSYDGEAIAFSTARINTDATGELMRPSESFYKDALILHRKTGRIVSLSANRPLRGMTFPEFQKNGSVMLLDQIAPGRSVEIIRVVKVK